MLTLLLKFAEDRAEKKLFRTFAFIKLQFKRMSERVVDSESLFWFNQRAPDLHMIIVLLSKPFTACTITL